jgi:hypothetical protein
MYDTTSLTAEHSLSTMGAKKKLQHIYLKEVS